MLTELSPPELGDGPKLSLVLEAVFSETIFWCAPPCVAKKLCHASRFARLVGRLWADLSKCPNVPGAMKQMLVQWPQSEAPRRSWKVPGPENQDSHHKQN